MSYNFDTHSSKASWSTYRIAFTALFTAVAIAVSFIAVPIFPMAPYLKYDPSGIICLIAGFSAGPATGVTVSVLMWVFHLFTNPLGALMGCLSTVAYVLPASLIYKHFKQKNRDVLGMASGTILSVVLSILGNLVITPLYTPISVWAVAAMILPILLPFNLLKLLINSVVTKLIYKRVQTIIEHSNN